MKKTLIALSLFAFIGGTAIASGTFAETTDTVTVVDTDKKKDKKKKKCASDCAKECCTADAKGTTEQAATKSSCSKAAKSGCCSKGAAKTPAKAEKKDIQ